MEFREQNRYLFYKVDGCFSLKTVIKHKEQPATKYGRVRVNEMSKRVITRSHCTSHRIIKRLNETRHDNSYGFACFFVVVVFHSMFGLFGVRVCGIIYSYQFIPLIFIDLSSIFLSECEHLYLYNMLCL